MHNMAFKISVLLVTFLYLPCCSQACLNPKSLSSLTLQFLSYGDGKFINRAPSENSLVWLVLSLNPYTCFDISGKEDRICFIDCLFLDIQKS